MGEGENVYVVEYVVAAHSSVTIVSVLFILVCRAARTREAALIVNSQSTTFVPCRDCADYEERTRCSHRRSGALLRNALLAASLFSDSPDAHEYDALVRHGLTKH